MKTKSDKAIEKLVLIENLYKQYHEKCNRALMDIGYYFIIGMWVLWVVFYILSSTTGLEEFEMMGMGFLISAMIYAGLKLAFYFPKVRRLLNSLTVKLAEVVR